MIVPYLIAAVIAGAALQSATGFGFSLLAAPILFALLDPQPAIGLLALLGIVVNLMTLLTEGRRPRPLVREATIIAGSSMPGALLGVVVLRSLDPIALQVLLTGGIITTLLVRRVQAARSDAEVPEGGRPRPRWSAPLAGLLAGGLSTSISTSGPPMLVHLLGRGIPPMVVRDTLTVCFMSLGLITPIALIVTRTTEAIPDGSLVALAIPTAVVGHLVGRRVFARLAHGAHYELVVTVVLVIAVTTGLIGALV